jgi:two-component system, NtrC family, response regulator HydG
MHKLNILILYPDPAGLALLTSMLKSLGHLIEEASNDRVAVRLMDRNNIDLVLAGVDPLDAEALELLTYMRRKHRDVPVILLFPRLHPERAKEALRLGAMAVLKYPVPAAELRAAVLQALERSEARSAAESPHQSNHTSQPLLDPKPLPHPSPNESPVAVLYRPPSANSQSSNAAPAVEVEAAPVARHRVEQFARDLGLVGHDPSWRQILDLAATIALTRSSVLIVGEPGTGKSLLARLIHSLGPHPDSPFVTVEGSVMADTVSLRDSDDSSRPGPKDISREWSGKLTQAQSGTLYLDELAALPLELQIHLLRELQFRDYEATAGHPAPPSEVRFLISTSENLPSLIEQGRLRQELYHRVSVISLMLPPLRHRGSDVELLAEWFRTKYTQEFHKSVVGFTHDALDVLRRHDWPGNVRELEAAIQRAVALCNGPRITSSHLAPILHHAHNSSRPMAGGTPRPHLQLGVRPLKEALEEPEKRIIIQALQAFHWNRQETARVLDINRTTLYKKMKKYNLLIDEPMGVH